MLLEYLDFNTKGIKLIQVFDKKGFQHSYKFNPKSEVPDDVGKKILEKFKKEFKEEGKPAWTPPIPDRLLCEICGYKGINIKSITMHKTFKHKEKKK